jgi:predicted transcriptional regulator
MGKQKILHDFKEIAFEIKSIKKSVDLLANTFDNLYKDMMENGSVVFKNNDGAKKSSN